MLFKSIVSISIAASLVAAQDCKPDILLDDFSHVRRGIVDEGATANMNLQGGGYGGMNVHEHFIEAKPGIPHSGKVIIRANKEPNWWFFKVEKNACFDLRDYTAIQMQVKFPVGSYGKIAITQKSKGCHTAPDHGRIIEGILISSGFVYESYLSGAESDFHNISKFMVPDGKIQTLTIPIHEFSRRWNTSHVDGAQFDLEHFKDFTFIELTHHVPYKFYRITLIGNCDPNDPRNKNGANVPAGKNENGENAPESGTNALAVDPSSPTVSSTVSDLSTPTQSPANGANDAMSVTGISIIATSLALFFTLVM